VDQDIVQHWAFVSMVMTFRFHKSGDIFEQQSKYLASQELLHGDVWLLLIISAHVKKGNHIALYVIKSFDLIS
jgi:hypothetical protein